MAFVGRQTARKLRYIITVKSGKCRVVGQMMPIGKQADAAVFVNQSIAAEQRCIRQAVGPEIE